MKGDRLSIPLFVTLGALTWASAACQGESPVQPPGPSPFEFLLVMRPYLGEGYDEVQYGGLRELGVGYLQGHSSLAWPNVEPRDDDWKWGWADQAMDLAAAHGLKINAFFITPKLEGLHWNSEIHRDDPRYVAEYEELAYEVTKRYARHPAWAGIVSVWGGSSDVFGEHPLQNPDVQVPLLNAAYDGVKRADPRTIVVGFNMATTLPDRTPSDWEAWHEAAFALGPRFDWFGVQSHNVPVTVLGDPGSYAGLQGLVNVRRFLDAHGSAETPIFLNEGGFLFGEDIGGWPEEAHAEQVVETFVLAPTLGVNLAGWVLFEYFGETHRPEDYGLMTPLDEASPPRPRMAWQAVRTLVRDVRFYDYEFVRKISGEVNQPLPSYALEFAHRLRPMGRLWVVFSPRVSKEAPAAQEVRIDISPAREATRIEMLGGSRLVEAGEDGFVTLTSISSPVYLVSEE